LDIKVDWGFGRSRHSSVKYRLEAVKEDGRGLEVVIRSFHWIGEKDKWVRG
jgi:hypothetical protein